MEESLEHESIEDIKHTSKIEKGAFYLVLFGLLVLVAGLAATIALTKNSQLQVSQEQVQRNTETIDQLQREVDLLHEAVTTLQQELVIANALITQTGGTPVTADSVPVDPAPSAVPVAPRYLPPATSPPATSPAKHPKKK